MVEASAASRLAPDRLGAATVVIAACAALLSLMWAQDAAAQFRAIVGIPPGADEVIARGASELSQGLARFSRPAPPTLQAPPSELLVLIERGELAAAVVPTAALRSIAPDFGVFDALFLFDNLDSVERFERSDAGRRLLRSLREHNLTGADYWHYGMRQLATTGAPITSASSLRGRQILTTSDLTGRQFERLGANPRRAPFAEAAQMLRSGAADGIETSGPLLRNLTDGAVRSVTFSNHRYDGYVVVLNRSLADRVAASGGEAELTRSIENIGREVNGAVRERERQIAASTQQRVAVETIDPATKRTLRDALGSEWRAIAGPNGDRSIAAALDANVSSGSSTPAPPPPPPTPGPAPPPVSIPEPASAFLWNVWAQLPPEQRPASQPLKIIERGGVAYKFVADLSTFAYRPGDPNVRTAPAPALEDWIVANREPTFQAVVLPDEAYFDLVSNRVSEITINKDRLRKAKDGLSRPTGDVFDLINARDPGALDFRLATITFDMLPKKAGWGRVSIAFFANGRYVDELTVAFCIALPSCGEAPAYHSALSGTTVVRLGGEATIEVPDAALYFLELPQAAGATPVIMGLLNVNKDAGQCRVTPHMTWSISERNDLRSGLETRITALQNTENVAELRTLGTDLQEFLFRDSSGKAALDALQCFAIARTESAGARKPVLFTRIALRDNSSPPIIPLGLVVMSSGGTARFLAEMFRVEMPLRNQRYEQITGCQQTWATAITPVLDGQADPGEVLKTARRAMHQDVIEKWETRYYKVSEQPQGSVSIRGLRRWMSPPAEDDRKPVALFVLSHHDQDSLFYDSSERLTATMVHREFARPSFVVLNACRTASVSNNSFVSALDNAHVDAVIASVTNADNKMAGVFYRCMDHEISGAPVDKPKTLTDVFAATVQCVAKEKKINGFEGDREMTDIDPYGANAYKYSLLGNGSIPVCLNPGGRP